MDIINFIRNKEIEKAYELIEKFIPELLKEGYIVAFLKAHIFLRIVKNGIYDLMTESNSAAISYSQKEKATF